MLETQLFPTQAGYLVTVIIVAAVGFAVVLIFVWHSGSKPRAFYALPVLQGYNLCN